MTFDKNSLLNRVLDATTRSDPRRGIGALAGVLNHLIEEVVSLRSGLNARNKEFDTLEIMVHGLRDDVDKFRARLYAPHDCWVCDGQGVVPTTNMGIGQECARCKGTGKITLCSDTP